jgi:hypothetical protein
MVSKTHSELLLEQYLSGRAISFEREPNVRGKSKRPDYLIDGGSARVWLEVKEFDAPERRPKQGEGFSPCPAIARKIERAREKFKEFREDCCALVLHSCKSIYRSAETDAVLSTMFGEYFQRTPLLLDCIEDVPSRFRFFGTAKLSKNSNTTLSAIIILQHYSVNELWVSVMNELLDRQANGEKLPPGASLQLLADHQNDPIEITHPHTVRCVVLENPYARFGLPTHLFAGPFDQCWGRDRDDYTMLWTGAELVKLRNRSKPVPFIYL